MPAFDAAAYRAAFDRMGLPAVLTDDDLQVRDATPAAATALPVEGSLAGLALADVVDAETVAAVRDALGRGERWRGRFSAGDDRHRVACRGTASPVTVDGRRVGVCLAFVDVTERRRHEDASAVLDRLLRHDLRNDINLVLGYLYQASERATDEATRSHVEDAVDLLDDVVAKSARARDLRDLLDRSADTTLHPVGLDDLLVDRLMTLTADHPAVDVRWGDLPAVEVVADDLLGRVIEALLENAVVHNEGETRTVEVSVEAHDDHVCLRVADDGPGVEQDEATLFGRTLGDPVRHGTGLSLFFVDRVVESYGGVVHVTESDLGGAEFVVDLQRVG